MTEAAKEARKFWAANGGIGENHNVRRVGTTQREL
jgi:hypothetical protein